MKNTYTAESVTPKHPDKMCDRISDAILDAYLAQDPDSRVAVETMGGHGHIFITGEVTSKAKIDEEAILRRIVGGDGLVTTTISKQSPDIARGVDIGGAGDQGIVVGYACRDNKEYLPQEFYLARKLCQYLYSKFPEDGKTQVTFDKENNSVMGAVASFNNVPQKVLFDEILNFFKIPEFKYNLLGGFPGPLANPAGDWSVGSFDADTGLTGRKIVVDNYGPQVEVGGGAFSGKDATKVDRTGAYYARYLAVRDLLDTPKAVSVKVKMAFAIGWPRPVMLTHTVTFADGSMMEFSQDMMSGDSSDRGTVAGMIKMFNLREPNFERTAEWGAFGNGFAWDKF